VQLWVGNTNYDWFRFQSARDTADEVNFWSPSPTVGFRALSLGEPFLFKLKAPYSAIAGGGFFTKFEKLPLSVAWQTFGQSNGAATLRELFFRIYGPNPKVRLEDDPIIGCTILTEPFFFNDGDWIPKPKDFSPNLQRGRLYKLWEHSGKHLWIEVSNRLVHSKLKSNGPATIEAQENARYGKPQTVMPRLGQGAFRVMVSDAYTRRCAITQERTLPALEAAHIHRYSWGGDHSLSNGILLRSDLHRLFDRGYLTIEPTTMKVLVSKRIREEFENGRDYYDLEDRLVQKPVDANAMPSVEKLRYHYEEVFKRPRL
jgi:putative restriction endonuclease